MPHVNCHGCSLCQLSCPMWQQRRDVAFSPKGIFRALQHDAPFAEIAEPLFSCVMCGACDTLCPAEIEITATITRLRAEALTEGINVSLGKQIAVALQQPRTSSKVEQDTILLPGAALRGKPDTLERLLALLSTEKPVRLACDDGDDIAAAIEAGVVISDYRLHTFLEPLQGAKRLYVSNGLLLRKLREWLPATELCATGHTLSRMDNVVRQLRPDDLYLIEARSYHLDHRRQVAHYDRLRHQQGCQINLDLQRSAIPTAASGLGDMHPQLDKDEQRRWLLEGRNIRRIIVECAADGEVMSQLCDLPVLHIADLAETPSHA